MSGGAGAGAGLGRSCGGAGLGEARLGVSGWGGMRWDEGEMGVGGLDCTVQSRWLMRCMRIIASRFARAAWDTPSVSGGGAGMLGSKVNQSGS